MKPRPLHLHLFFSVGAACALALGAVSARADYAAAVSSLNPLGYWRLNQPAQPPVPTYPMLNSSAAGDALDGAYHGVPLLGQPGAMSGSTAANFNGTGQYAEAPYSPALNPDGPFTVEFWANLTNATAGAKSGVVSRYETGGAFHGYLFFVNNGNTKWQFRIHDGAGRVTVTDTDGPDILADAWYHVVGVYDGSQISIYVNGVRSSAPVAAPTYVPNANSPLRIGAGSTEAAPSLFFPGLIDNVAVYPMALTAAQIAANYSAASTNPAGYNAQILALNPNAYWRMDESAFPPYTPYAATNSGTLGAALDGAYIGSAVSGEPGPLGGQFAGFEADNRAVGLNGSTTFVSVPGFDQWLNAATFVGWIKRTGDQVNASPFILQRGAGSPATGLVVDFNNRLGYVWNDDAGSYSYNPGPDFFIPENVWTFAAVSVSPDAATIYIGSTNGLLAATRTAGHMEHWFGDADLRIGRDGGSAARTIRGHLDEIAIFGEALDFNAVSNLFYAATPALMNFTRTPADPAFEGVDVTYTAYAVSSAPVDYQWRKDGSPIGENSPTLSLANVTPADDGDYEVVVTSGGVSVTSTVDTLSVVAGPPVVLTEPTPATRYEGASVMFSVAAGGTSPFSYQWLKDGTIITGATSDSYTITGITAADQAGYSVRVTNPLGNILSADAALTVLPAPSQYASVALHYGAVGYWALDETSGTTAFDYAGGLHGAIPEPPAVIPGADGPRLSGFDAANTGYELDGTVPSYVTVPPLNWNANTVTFSAWVNYSGITSDLAGVVFSRGASASGMDIRGDGELRYHWNGGQWGFSSGLIVPQNEWVFLALVIEPSRGTLYLGTSEGLAAAVNETGHPVAALSDPLFFGRDRATDRRLIGVIDEVAVYRRALSLDELTSLHSMAIDGPQPPVIASQPVAATRYEGSTARFSVAASGLPPFSYQWRSGGVPIDGATAATLTVPNVQLAQSGTAYSVSVTAPNGSIDSSSATLTVLPIASLPPYGSTITALNPWAYWQLNEPEGTTAHDYIGGFDATYGQWAQLGQEGPRPPQVEGFTETNLAPYFDGATDSWVALPPLGFTSTSATITAWVLPEGDQADWSGVVFTRAAGTVAGLGYGEANELGYTWNNNSGATWGFASELMVPTDVWSFVALVVEPEQATLYLGTPTEGGLRSAVNVLEHTAMSFNGTTYLGWDPASDERHYKGKLDEVALFNHALTPAEMQLVYNSGLGIPMVELTITPTPTGAAIAWPAGTLEAAGEVNGDYSPVPGASSPWPVNADAAGMFYRVRVQ